MTTMTMNAVPGGKATREASSRRNTTLSLATVKFLQQRASLPEMPAQETHASAFVGIALRLTAALLSVAAMAWLALAG